MKFETKYNNLIQEYTFCLGPNMLSATVYSIHMSAHHSKHFKLCIVLAVYHIH